MFGLRALLLCVAATCMPLAGAQVIYAGFDHIISFKKGKATAYDYRRNLVAGSTCDIVAGPPLLKDAGLNDWIMKGIEAVSSAKQPVYTYLGYELFMTEQKDTGAYVIRRCRDFRPQLSELPCEAFATGFADKFKAPFKTVWLGHNRIMIVDTHSGHYTVHPFDADVHTGGDPFKFSSGPIHAGTLPVTMGLDAANFAVVHLPDGSGDILFVQAGDGRSMGYLFDGKLPAGENMILHPVIRINTAWNTTLTSLGEDRLLSYTPTQDYEVRQIFFNVSDFKSKVLHSGNLGGGVDCMIDNATACVKRTGCAWCPSTYTCHNYDLKSGLFCDRASCAAAPIVESLGERPVVVVPDCADDPAMEHANIIDTLDEGYEKLLPGNKRLDPSYRDNSGEHAQANAAPVHYAIDNELGDDPVVIPDDESPDQTILTENRVSQGNVYVPPPISESAPCMDDGYNSFKGMDSGSTAAATVHMNHQATFNGESADVLTMSPLGDANATKKTDCLRNKDLASSNPPNDDYHPKEPAKENATRTELYMPDNSGTMAEEGVMNGDESVSLGAQWLNPSKSAVRGDAYPVHSPLSPTKGDLEFKPKEPTSAGAVKPKVFARPPQPTRKSTEELMEVGLTNTDPKLAGADCTETGGEDGFASDPMTATMANVVTPTMPRTLEDQLALFDHEQKKVEDWMPAGEPDTQLGKVNVGVTLPILDATQG